MLKFKFKFKSRYSRLNRDRWETLQQAALTEPLPPADFAKFDKEEVRILAELERLPPLGLYASLGAAHA